MGAVRAGEPSPIARVGRLVVLAVVLLGLGAGVFFFIDAMHKPRRTEARFLADYQDLCGGRPIPGAAPYQPGAGPHPMAVFANDQDDVSGTGGILVSFAPPDPLLNPSKHSSVQLVACTERVDEGEQVGTCEYRESTAPLYRATVEITVYEARTAKQVGEPITLEGQSQKCPMFAWSRGSSEPTVYTTPTQEQYREALAPFLR